MRHPSEGVLRRLLDEPAGVADRDREHVADCSQCLAGLAAMRDDAVLVESALETEAGADVDVDAAWRRLSAARRAGDAAHPAARPRRSRVRAALRRPAVAAFAVGVVLTGAGTAAANGWLEIFRTERIAPITLSESDLTALPDLEAYGDLEFAGDGDGMKQVRDAEAAEAQSDLDVPVVPDLPRGVTGEPTLHVGDEVSATFTFSTEQAARAATKAGETLPTPPPGLDGSRVRLVAGPGVAQVWSSSTGAPALIVGRAVAPKAFSSGVGFETVRDYLLGLPGLPGDVAAQLRSFNGDGSSLPLPVPADEVTTSSTQVDGAPATVLVARDKTMAAVVWVDEGVATAVAGSLDSDEVLSIARNLR